jgi:hypothetical protein
MIVRDFWYDRPQRSDGSAGRYVLGLVFDQPGLVSVDFHLGVPEMEAAYAALARHDDSDLPSPHNIMWWAYEWVGPDDTFGPFGADVPLRLYRDDHCLVDLPHAVGERVLEILAARLAEVRDNDSPRPQP